MEATIHTILQDVSVFVTQAFGWVGSVLDVIADNPILFMFVVAVPLVGLGVGLVKRLIAV